MQNCVGCLTPVPSKCVISEQDLSFSHENLDDIIDHLDKAIILVNKTLTAPVDKKWVKDNVEFITDYIQIIINKIDVLQSQTAVAEQKFRITSELTGGEEKTALQLFTIILKELDALKKKSNTITSSLYTPNV